MLKHTQLISKSHTWSSLEQVIAGLPDPKLRGDVFEEFCLAYLRLTPEYQIKHVWIQGDFPSHIIEKLKLSGQRDQGIDLVAETTSGSLWAVQAKFRSDRKNTVSYKELSTFLAVSDRADYRLIISNTDQLPSIIGKRSRCGEALIDRLSLLGEKYFSRLHRFLEEGKPVELKALSPKPHQMDAISASTEHFKTNDRGQLIMACGSGKTLTAVWIAENLQSKKILVMVPSLALMRQTVSVWAENFKATSLNYMCICSDASVTEEAKSDRFVGNLWEMDIPVTTNPEEAKKFIIGNDQKPLIVFSTYQSSDVLSKAILGKGEFRFDLAICDEAHRTAGMNKGLFNLVLDDKHVPCHKRLFMTATPRILDKHIVKRGQEEDVELFSMADEEKYGKEFYRLSFGEAIRLKLLCDYKVAVAVVTDDEVRQVISLRNKVQIESEKIFEREAEGLAKQIAFIKAVTQYGIKHTISFHSRVADARIFSDGESDHGLGAVNKIMKKYEDNTPHIRAFHVNGAVPAGQRASIIEEFANSDVSVISNARCLTEGVDIPSVDGVVFYDPKYRLTDIVQATGRALRLYEGKKCGYLVIPVFLKAGENADHLLDSSDFSQVWAVIKAMQSQDERLDEIIRSLRVMDGQRDGGDEKSASGRESLEKKLHEYVLIERIPNKISPEQFIKKIDIKLLDELSSSWDYKFGLLKAFRKQNPDRWPKSNEEFPKGNKLGMWCHAQRMRHKKTMLLKEKVDQLNEIGFRWEEEDVWTPQYENLIQFRKQNPDGWPSHGEEFPKGNKLGAWCTNQRALFKNKKLSQDRVDRLDQIRFIWMERKKNPWIFEYEVLIKFRKQNPDRWPTGNEEFPRGNNLGSWCAGQKAVFGKGKLLQNRLDLLNKIGFIWKEGDLWTPQYENLIKFRKQNPDRWPTSYEEFPKGNKLGRWCQIQRMDYKKTKLSKERVGQLREIGFLWEREDLWTPQYESLIEFRKQNPERWPSHDEEFPKGSKLGWWCVVQRRQHRNNKIFPDRVERLNKIGFPWKFEFWTPQYEALIEFRKINPDRWPVAMEEFPKGNKLGSWCAMQKSNFNKDVLPKDRVDLLNKIGFLWAEERDFSSWDSQYKNLTQFRKQNPDRWPAQMEEFPKGNKLGSWCAKQKSNFNKDALPKDRLEFLNKIGFIWKEPDSWMPQYKNLVEFRKQNPDRWPAQMEAFPKGNKLGAWCAAQKVFFRKNKLSQDRVDHLKRIGFILNDLDTWTTQYKNLVKFRRQNPDRWPESNEEFPKGYKLGRWCALQNELFKKDKLTQGRIDSLTNIGFVWSKEDQWTLHYEQLIDFKKQNPDKWPVFNRWTAHIEGSAVGSNLGAWCSVQKRLFKKGKLSQIKIDLLNKIGFIWNDVTIQENCINASEFINREPDSWITQYKTLIQFRKQNPERWPNNDEEFPRGNRLGEWCTRQKTFFEKGLLPQDQVDRFNSIGFIRNEEHQVMPGQPEESSKKVKLKRIKAVSPSRKKDVHLLTPGEIQKKIDREKP